VESTVNESKAIGFFGGVYSNYLALQSLLQDAPGRGIKELYCLGDLGAFGPHPDRVCRILRQAIIPTVQGNYDHSVGNGLDDCQCGYTDPRDNYFAKLSYDYTFAKTSLENRNWLRTLPTRMRIQLGSLRVLLCHGSPRKTNEFLWETTTSNAFLNWLFEIFQADVIVATHTGLPWHRQPSPGRHFINCGAIGRPGNDGRTTVVYASIRLGVDQSLDVEFIDLNYDRERLAAEMRAEQLPEEFVETILTGWWTTCNEVLPGKERARGMY
jgi:diadenosine tetraphosphatase ApaH/serine/threonine PP2A family protein phosphatase